MFWLVQAPQLVKFARVELFQSSYLLVAHDICMRQKLLRG